jgi:hypothetical protein
MTPPDRIEQISEPLTRVQRDEILSLVSDALDDGFITGYDYFGRGPMGPKIAREYRSWARLYLRDVKVRVLGRVRR